jgi:hypothetical protein
LRASTARPCLDHRSSANAPSATASPSPCSAMGEPALRFCVQSQRKRVPVVGLLSNKAAAGGFQLNILNHSRVVFACLKIQALIFPGEVFWPLRSRFRLRRSSRKMFPLTK